MLNATQPGRKPRPMQNFTKRQIRNLMIALIASNLIFIAEAQLLITIRSEKDFFASSSLTLWTAAAIIYTVFLMARIWNQPARYRHRINSRPPGTSSPARRMSPTTGILLIQFGLLVSPNVWGIILIIYGLPNIAFYLFPGISLATGIAWGIHYLRTASL
jgi:hypothetical protein